MFLYTGGLVSHDPITSSHTFISLLATSSPSSAKKFFADDDKHDGMLEVILPCVFTLLPAQALSLFVLEEYYHLPVFVPLSSRKEFPADPNLVTCHEKCRKKEAKCCQTAELSSVFKK